MRMQSYYVSVRKEGQDGPCREDTELCGQWQTLEFAIEAIETYYPESVAIDVWIKGVSLPVAWRDNNREWHFTEDYEYEGNEYYTESRKRRFDG